jgi:cyclic-di-GMP phosphodiesterase TipF (flagellum assembly factor)
MNIRQRSSRYGAAVLFLAGIAGTLLFVAILRSGLQPDFEIWLASALVASLILHARAGFALSRAQQEIELLRGLVVKFDPAKRKPKVTPFEGLSPANTDGPDDAEMLDRVKRAIESDRIDLYLQPIVNLANREERYFEAFSRLRNEDGSILRPVDYLEAAERANRIGLIDNMILLRAVQALRDFGAEYEDARIFCNISPATIFDSDFFVKFSDYLDANNDLARRLVFEFTYPAVEIMHDRVEKNLDLISRRGYAFSVDHIRRFDLNWRALRAKNFRYVKMSSALLLSAKRNDDDSQSRLADFINELRENDMELIVEKIESEAAVPDLVELGAEFGQGELFGAPRPVDCYLNMTEELKKAS